MYFVHFVCFIHSFWTWNKKLLDDLGFKDVATTPLQQSSCTFFIFYTHMPHEQNMPGVSVCMITMTCSMFAPYVTYGALYRQQAVLQPVYTHFRVGASVPVHWCIPTPVCRHGWAVVLVFTRKFVVDNQITGAVFPFDLQWPIGRWTDHVQGGMKSECTHMHTQILLCEPICSSGGAS